MSEFFAKRKETQQDISRKFRDAYLALAQLLTELSKPSVLVSSTEAESSEVEPPSEDTPLISKAISINQDIHQLKIQFITKLLSDAKKIKAYDPEKMPHLTKILVAAKQAIDNPTLKNIQQLNSTGWTYRRGSDAFTGITYATSGLALALMAGGFAAVVLLAPPIGGVMLAVGAVVTITASLCHIFHRLNHESLKENRTLANEVRQFGSELKAKLRL